MTHTDASRTASRQKTAEDLYANPVPGKCTELVAGRILVREPPGYRHGFVASRCLVAIATFANTYELGHVLAAETGFVLARAPDTVRAPDVAFVSSSRAPLHQPAAYLEQAPDLVVEVVSPSDRASRLRAKVSDWIGAGVRLVWQIDPERRTARVYRQGGALSAIDADGMLDGEDVLPGFRVRLADLLD
jgi:Uma2 family endonuclease